MCLTVSSRLKSCICGITFFCPPLRWLQCDRVEARSLVDSEILSIRPFIFHVAAALSNSLSHNFAPLSHRLLLIGSPNSIQPGGKCSAVSLYRGMLSSLIRRTMASEVKKVPIPSRGVDYRGRIVLAPMVRSGELPSRLLALHYGADLVWGAS
jgi:hypothetical protein